MMSEKQKNLITRSIFGALFVAIMVLGFTRPPVSYTHLSVDVAFFRAVA